MKDKLNVTRYLQWKAQWSDKDSIDVFSYISFNLHPEDVLVASEIFFYDFVEFENCVFIESKFSEENYYHWKKKLVSKIAVEKVINHIHVYDLFANCTDEVDESVFVDIGKRIRKILQLLLQSQYPNKNIIVEYLNDDSTYGSTVRFYQADVG